ncbi:MAG: 1-acyl-sn-glycerol-3-phosphate acyltransferase [Bacteroidales bacterium]|nr:MAG: 1-acyl-sn-glycerol-3-phosphate acyltransferase [Bacteroidales bacterium]
MIAVIRSMLSYIVVISLVIGLFPPALVIWFLTFPLDRKRIVLHFYTCLWGSLFVWTNPMWRVIVTNRRRIEKGKTYILVSNHQSMFDIVAIYLLFRRFKWVSKSENYSLPVIGWTLRLNNYIKLERESRKSIMKMMKECEEAIRNGSSIMMFPEGTRSLDGEIRHFKTGAFLLALNTETPIIPIVLDGSGVVLPKKGFILSPNRKIKLNVMEEIPFKEFKHLNAMELMNMTREIMEKELTRIRYSSS